MGQLLMIEQVLMRLLLTDPDNEANAAHLQAIQEWIAQPELMSAAYRAAVAAHQTPVETAHTDSSTHNFSE